MENIILTDTLPTSVKLIGNVYINNEIALYKLSGNALSVMVGNLLAGETATISFDAQVLDSAVGTTLTNVAVLDGDNGSSTATDKRVSVPERTQNSDDNTGFYVIKDVDKTVIDVSKGAATEKRKVNSDIYNYSWQ